jgi:hypothetical protein
MIFNFKIDIKLPQKTSLHTSGRVSKIKTTAVLMVTTIFLTSAPTGYAQTPTRLTTDLIEHTDQVFLDGYATNISLPELNKVIERYQTAAVRNPKPRLGWVVNSDKPNTVQTAYRILVASSAGLIDKNEADIWDSGRTESDNSISVTYNGKPLQPSTVYFWKVKTWNNHGQESPYSETRSFITATELDGKTARYPIQLSDERPTIIKRLNDGVVYIDFGKDAWGRLKLTLSSAVENDTVTIHLSERVTNGRLDRKPGGSIRYANYRLPLMRGTHTYIVKLRPDARNTNIRKPGGKPILMPGYIGEVTPFRCCEIENYNREPTAGDVVRLSAHYPFDDTAASFVSSDTTLNRIWELCKYSIKTTSVTGTYIDGDRERIPYENEALISQLGQYRLDREYSIARHSHEHLLFSPTWPTEYIMKSIWMAWNDYLYTGNPESMKRYYEDIKAKSLLGLRENNGLISTRTGKKTPELLATIHFGDKSSAMQDIVDWPPAGFIGMKGGETDGFVFTDYNSVVNAFHYLSLCQLAKIAEALDNREDNEKFIRLAAQMKKDFNSAFLDKKKGYYNDGVDTDHSSLHANMYALAFGLVPEKNVKTVLDFIHSRGMACSIHGALVLMEALYKYNDADYAMQLLASTAERSWYNTIRMGATISVEAWDNKYKPNLDWNQSAGSVPAYVIPRHLMGVEPLEPGFGKIRIHPQPGALQHAEIKTPCIRGDVRVAFDNRPGESFVMETEIPANTTAEIMLPKVSGKYSLTVDGMAVKGEITGNSVKVAVGSGKHQFEIKKQ